MSKIIKIDGKLVNLEKIHFIRKEAPDSLLISFGTDFLRFRKEPEEISIILDKIEECSNEKFSSTNQR